MSIEKGTELIGGQIVMWEMSPSSVYSAVRTAAIEHGLGGCLPSPRTPESALSGAMAECFEPLDKQHKIFVRPVKSGDDGIKKWSVFDEDPKIKDDSRFTLINTCWINGGKFDEDGNRIDCDSCPLNVAFDRYLSWEKQDELRDKWRWLRSTLSTGSMGSFLATCVLAMGGIPLRDRGGCYWIPQRRVDRWQAFARQIQQANAFTDKDHKSKIYGINIVADDSMVECVGDQMVRELSSRLQDIQDAIITDDGVTKLRKNSVSAKKQELAEMRQMAGNFTDCFRRHLGELEHKFVACEALLATYTIMESAAAEKEIEEREAVAI